MGLTQSKHGWTEAWELHYDKLAQRELRVASYALGILLVWSKELSGTIEIFEEQSPLTMPKLKGPNWGRREIVTKALELWRRKWEKRE